MVFSCVLLSFGWWSKLQWSMFTSVAMMGGCVCVACTDTCISLFGNHCLHLHRKCQTQRWQCQAAAGRWSLAVSSYISTKKRRYYSTFSVTVLQAVGWGFANDLNILIALLSKNCNWLQSLRLKHYTQWRNELHSLESDICWLCWSYFSF